MLQNHFLSLNSGKEYGYNFFIFVIVFYLASAGFPSFRFLSQYNFLLLPFILFVINRKGLDVPRSVYKILFFVGILSTIHFAFGHLTLIGSITLILTIAVALYSAVMMGQTFIQVFIIVMNFFAITSLIIWIAVVLVPGFHSVLVNFASHLPQMMSEEWIENNSNEGVSLYLYYLPINTSTAYTSFIRNNGPFYEPGLFASYLNIALAFNMCLNRRLVSAKSTFLILAILSTCSSAGYISFALIVVLSVFMQNKWIYKIITVIVIFFLWKPVMDLEFMADKIYTNYDNALISSTSRFGAIIYHWEKVQKSPIIGYAGGTTPVTDFDRYLNAADKVLSPNVLSYLFVFWGIPLAIVFYIQLYKGIKKITGIKEQKILLSLYLIILSTAFSQTITVSLTILTLVALSFTLKENYYENSSH